MMMCDVRHMHQDDVLPMWKIVRKHLHKGDYKVDIEDGELFLELKAGGWRFSAHARGYFFEQDGTLNFENATVFMGYYPPNGGRVRFDSHVNAKMHSSYEYDERLARDNRRLVDTPRYWSVCPELVKEYGEAFIKYGRYGHNRLAHYHPTMESPEVAELVSDVQYSKKPWWKFW